MDKNLIIGTAGHIDHGKTTLIKALTGKDTDRLKQEKKRGISIELGFSRLKLNDNLQVGIIDVPGHEKFIKNMLAGAGGVDLALLVVAADEDVMPQTEEHLAILDLLEVEYGVVAVTKSDLVEEEWLELVVEEIREKFKDTFLEMAPIVPVSAIEDEGIDQLKEELEKIIKDFPAKDEGGNVYFPIDRVFSLTGHGTVITGTLIKGKISEGDRLKVYPKGIDLRVRSLEVHEESVDTAYPGQRVGINLAGVDTDDLDRGDVLATSESLTKTNYLDGRLKLLDSAPMVLKHGDRIRLHLGAKEVLGRVYLLDKEELYPGEQGLVQFNLEEEVVANFKERYILRRYSPMTTIGGGEILDSNPKRHRRFDEDIIETLEIKDKGSREQRVKLSLKLAVKRPLTIQDLIKETSLASEELIEVLSNLKEQKKAIEFNATKELTWTYDGHYNKLKKDIINYVQDYHQQYHLRLGMPKEELRTKLFMNLDPNEYNLILEDLEQEDKVEMKSAVLKLKDFALKLNSKEKALKEKIINSLNKNKFMPPKLDELIDQFKDKELVEELFNYLIACDKVVKVKQNLYFSKQALNEAKEKLINYLKENQEIELGEFRDLLESSRKYALPLIEYFDQQGITKRKDNKRILIGA